MLLSLSVSLSLLLGMWGQETLKCCKENYSLTHKHAQNTAPGLNHDSLTIGVTRSVQCRAGEKAGRVLGLLGPSMEAGEVSRRKKDGTQGSGMRCFCGQACQQSPMSSQSGRRERHWDNPKLLSPS